MNTNQMSDISSLLELIREAQTKAHVYSNTALAALYHHIGKLVSQKIEQGKWNRKTLQSLADYIRTELVQSNHINRLALFRMYQFFCVHYPGSELNFLIKEILSIIRPVDQLITSKMPRLGNSVSREREALTEAELTIIYTKQFSNQWLDKVKDIFVFSCFTGLAYSDVYSLYKDEIKVGTDGQQWIETYRKKTRTPYKISLSLTALSILEKYRDYPRYINQYRLLPVLSLQRMNFCLKEIANQCNIKKKLTFDTARRTFTANATSQNFKTK